MPLLGGRSPSPRRCPVPLRPQVTHLGNPLATPVYAVSALRTYHLPRPSAVPSSPARPGVTGNNPLQFDIVRSLLRACASLVGLAPWLYPRRHYALPPLRRGSPSPCRCRRISRASLSGTGRSTPPEAPGWWPWTLRDSGPVRGTLGTQL